MLDLPEIDNAFFFLRIRQKTKFPVHITGTPINNNRAGLHNPTTIIVQVIQLTTFWFPAIL